MWVWFSKLGSPKWFYELSGKWLPWLIAAMVIFMTIGLVWGLVFLPPDYQQGFTSRILIVHVAVAGTSLAFFPLMLVAGTITLVWRMKLADMVAKHAAILGAWFSFITLATGSLWGSVMWGTWWVWDARLTSVLILFLMYLGIMALWRAVEDPSRAARAAAILTLVGAINIPIIKFSVDWWNTLHQGASVFRAGGPTMDRSFLVPLLVMAIAFSLLFLTLHLAAMRNEIMRRRVRTLQMMQASKRTK